MELPEILAHEQKLLAGMAQHKGVACFQVGELIFIFAGHLVNHRAFQVDNLIV